MAEAVISSGNSRPGPFAVWIQAVRAPSLTASAMPVLLGAAIAARAGFFSLPRLILALLGAIAIQAGTNLINDYYDHVKGADSETSLGPSLVIQKGLLTAEEVWLGGIAAFAIGAVLGLTLVYLCGWPILALGIPSVAAGYFYTAAPVSLAYLALGEITVFIFMGPVIVLGTYYVMALQFSMTALAASIPVGLLVTGILQANNIRDIESDRAHSKHTLATILGRRGANIELAALDMLAYAWIAITVAFKSLPWTVLAVVLTIPRARNQLQMVFTQTDAKKLNVALFRSVQLHLEFGLLLIVAFVAAKLIGI